MRIELANIREGERLRAVDSGRVQALADSIAEIGLQTPITVTRLTEYEDGEPKEVWRLVAGLHRLEACRSLGLVDIEATEMADDEVLQKLWECDENLCRSELTDAQRARFTAERKRWYEVRHPETKHGAVGRAGKGRQDGDSSSERFTAETAARTGKSERSVQRDARRGTKIDPKALEIIEGTQGDNGKNLDTLAKLDPKEQVKAARRLADGKPVPLAARPLNEFESVEKQVSRLMSAWNSAGPEARADFLGRIDRPVFDNTRAA